MFIDFGGFNDISYTFTSTGLTPVVSGSLTDGLDGFYLTSANYGFTDVANASGGTDLSIDISLSGVIFDGTDAMLGTSVMTLQQLNMDAATAQSILDGGGSLNNLSFSGTTAALTVGSKSAPVPEPSSVVLISMGALGLGIVRYRKRRLAA